MIDCAADEGRRDVRTFSMSASEYGWLLSQNLSWSRTSLLRRLGVDSQACTMTRVGSSMLGSSGTNSFGNATGRNPLRNSRRKNSFQEVKSSVSFETLGHLYDCSKVKSSTSTFPLSVNTFSIRGEVHPSSTSGAHSGSPVICGPSLMI